MLWAIFAYRRGLLPPALLNTTDRRIFFADSRRFTKQWEEALQRATIIFSDQQIITGVSILLAGYANLFPSTTRQPLSAYHWQILTYLAWMSSNVHLTTLSLIRNWLQQNKILLIGRIVGMTVLVLLLIAALVPSMSYEFSVRSGGSLQSGVGIPAHCYWEHPGFGGVSVNAPFSVALLIVSYCWKLAQLNDLGRRKTRKWIRNAPECLLERLAISTSGLHGGMTKVQRVRFRMVSMVYVPFVIICEFIESFLASLWLVCFGLLWGSIQVFVPRSNLHQGIRLDENVWSFRQLLPLLLLLQPVSAILEYVCGKFAS